MMLGEAIVPLNKDSFVYKGKLKQISYLLQKLFQPLGHFSLNSGDGRGQTVRGVLELVKHLQLDNFFGLKIEPGISV